MNDNISVWINSLFTLGLNRLSWLGQLRGKIHRIISFGCWSSEPFPLLWYLDAQEIVVIEKVIENLFVSGQFGPVEEREVLEKKYPESLKGRIVNFINADMTATPILKSYFDFAFCNNVLYIMENDEEEVRKAISEMVRVVAPGGYIVAVEPKYGAEHDYVNTDWTDLPVQLKIPVPRGEAVDISFLFDGFPIERVELETPEFSYCYQKL